jgi:hypothetical protein
MDTISGEIAEREGNRGFPRNQWLAGQDQTGHSYVIVIPTFDEIDS